MREIKLRVWDSDNGMHYLNIEEMDDSLTFRSLRHFERSLQLCGIRELKESILRNVDKT